MSVIVLALRLAPIWIFFLAALALFQGLAARGGMTNRFAAPWTLATAAMAAMCIALTEAAGAFHQLTLTACVIAWLVADAAALGWSVRVCGGWRPAASAVRRGLRPAILGSPNRWARWLAWTAAGFLLVLGVFALATPTTVWDCQTFHMPRVMHWLQDKDVNNYATNIPRQLEYPPGVEMAVAQLVLLAGNDLPANLPQWWALMTGVVLAGFLAREFLAGEAPRSGKAPAGSGDLAAAGAAVLVLGAPDAAPQALSSLCDLAAAAWVLGALAFGWLLFKQPKNLIYRGGLAIVTALAISTKLTVGLYLAPFFLALGAGLIWKRFFAACAGAMAFGLAAIALLDGPWMARNWSLVGNAAGSRQSFAVNTPASFSMGGLGANLARNCSLYTQTPFGPVTAGLNALLETGMTLCGEDPADPQWTFANDGFEAPKPSRIDEGQGLGNFWAALVALTALGGAAMFFRGRTLAMVYLMALAASFVIFTGALRWDPWHDRLEMAYFILAAPLAAAALTVFFRGEAVVGCVGFLAFNAALTVCFNPTYPAFAALFGSRPREALYFAARPELYETTATLADDIVRAHCGNVLLKIGDDTWEYPLWALLKSRGFEGTIQHVLVKNESAGCGGGSWSLPGSVIVAMHTGEIAAPPGFGLEVTYDTWRSWWRGVAEERVRVVAGCGTLKYTFAQPGELVAHFAPTDLDLKPALPGVLDVTVKAIETNQFRTVAELRTNLPLSAVTTITCPVLAPSVTILVTNLTPGNHLAFLSRLDVVEQVPERH